MRATGLEWTNKGKEGKKTYVVNLYKGSQLQDGGPRRQT